MRNSTKFYTMLAGILLMLGSAKADHLADRLLFSARLNGANIIPTAVSSNASAVAGLMLNNTRDTLYMNFSATGLSGPITGIHIHEGSDKQNGAVLLDLDDAITGTTGKARIVVTPGLLKKMLRSEVYIAVHTAANPNGEIRGQVKLETDFGYYTEMDGMQQVPMNATTAKGVAALNLSLDGKRLEVKVVADGLTGAIQGAHLHKGAAGTNGGLLVDLSSLISADGRSMFGTVEIDDSIKSVFQSYVKMGLVYLNIHTAANAGGEVRGQIKYDANLRFDAKIDTIQITGNLAVSSMGIGVAKLSLNPTFDTLRYYFVVSNLTGAIASTHIHNAEPNADGPVVYEFPSTAINGNVISGMWTKTDGLNDELVNKLLYGSLYIAVHTASNPGGEVRGQIIRLAREGFMTDIDAMQAIPSSNSMGMGAGIASYDRSRNNLHYMITVDGLSGAINAAHFHKGIKGESGGVVNELTFTNNGSFGYWNATDMPGFNNTQSITFRRNDSVYVNFHTTNFPNGEVRGQLWRNYKNMGVVLNGTTTGINNVKANNKLISIYPNPAISIVNINTNSELNTTLSVIVKDITGKIITTNNYDVVKGNNILNLNIENLQSGIYLLQVKNNGIVSTTKLVVK